jgi:hypothetical protein
MSYPTFEEKRIMERYKEDENEFQSIYGGIQTRNIIGISELTSLDKMKNVMAELQNGIEIIIKKSIKDFDYSHDIRSFSKNEQNELWLIRNLIFYQLLIFATRVMTDITIFTGLYGNESKYKFRQEISDHIQSFFLGIFGSITPTSDIDLGIQYSGKENINGLAYVVSIVEDMFVMFLPLESSLKLDIETYADMVTITDNNGQEMFYLNTTSMSPSQFRQLLPSVGASVLRNYVVSQKEKDFGGIKQIVKSFNQWDSMIQTIMIDLIDHKIDTFYIDVMKEESWRQEAKKIIIDSMSKSYENSRHTYYYLVSKAEVLSSEIKEMILKGTPPSTDKIILCMKEIGTSLVYRAESYTSTSTVMHVVRLLQVNRSQKTKYKTKFPKCIKPAKILIDPFCNIGISGYLLSMIEQWGYINRFRITYCEKCKSDEKCISSYDKDKCYSKVKKYKERYNNALFLMKPDVVKSCVIL